MAALASHIQQNGGRVVGSFALTGKLYSATLRLSPKPFLNCEPAMAMSNKNSAKPLAAASTRSQNRKGVISPAMTRLTPSETESLLNDMRESMKVADELLKTASPLGSDTDDKARPPRASLLGPWNRAAAATAARRRCSPARSASPGEARRSSGPANRCRTSSGSYAISSSARSAHGQSRSPSRRAWRSCPIAGRPSWCRDFRPVRAARGSAPRLHAGAPVQGRDGAAEYLVRHGAVKLEDGALDTAGGKGLAEILAGLNGEHDHFMAWIAANRAERLAAEWEVRFENGVTERFADEAAARAEAAKWPGARAQSASRERLFTPEDIEAGKRLASGKMADGRDRAAAYREALAEFNTLQRSVRGPAVRPGRSQRAQALGKRVLRPVLPRDGGRRHGHDGRARSAAWSARTPINASRAARTSWAIWSPTRCPTGRTCCRPA